MDSPENAPTTAGGSTGGAEPPLPIPPPIAPPTEPGAMADPRHEVAVWPTIIGVVAIVFGSAGLLQAVAAAGGPAFVHAAASGIAAGAFTPEMVAVQDRWSGWSIAAGSAAFVLAALLLAGGILLVRRNRKCVPALTGWACAKLVYMLGMVALTWTIQTETFAAMKSQTPAAPVAAMMGPMMAVGVMINVIWLSALPVFMLLWLRSAVARREMARWSRPAG